MYKNWPYMLLGIFLTFISAQLLLSIGPVNSQTTTTHYPTEYTHLNNTNYVSGSISDLQSDNRSYMVFQSYASQMSAQTLYTHQETTMIDDVQYSLLGLENADNNGSDLVAPLNLTGRYPLGKFVYPLTGVTSIPSSWWQFYYRAGHSEIPEKNSINSPTTYGNGNWGTPNEAYTSDDTYAYVITPNSFQQYGNYGFDFPPEVEILSVEVGYEAYTSEDEQIEITLSWINGSTWVSDYISPQLENTDPNTVTWIDFSNVTDWTSSKLSDGAFFTRGRAIRAGLTMGEVYIDWLPVRVTYLPSPSASVSVNILIRRSDGTIRQAIATNVANSNALSNTQQTLSGNYSWPSYTVVDETDYLEIDYYLDVEMACNNVTAYLRIDDGTLTMNDQTRVAGVMLPNEYTINVEFSGSSSDDYWTQLLWTTDCAWSIDSVSVAWQLYNYSENAYASSGYGNIEYISSTIPETDELKSQVITVNPMDFRDFLGNWKAKVKCVKATTSQFYIKVDLVKYETTTINPPDIKISNVKCASNRVNSGSPVIINVTVTNAGETTETFNVTLYYNNTTIGTQFVNNLAPNESAILTFKWNTAGVSSGTHNIKAVAEEALGEINITDNTYFGETLEILLPNPNDLYSLFPYILPISIAAIGIFLGVTIKKRKTSSKFVGFDYFNKIIGGGIPVGNSVLITGNSASGKSAFCQQLAYKYLTENKACTFIAYDDFPSKIRENMKSFGWDLTKYEHEGSMTFIDCYSSVAGTKSQESHFMQNPLALTELSIITSNAFDQITDKRPAMFMDSTTTLFTNLEDSKVIRFLQNRGAKVKANGGIFIFTLGKGTVKPEIFGKLEDSVDCIIELDSFEEQGKNLRRIRVKKMRGQSHLEGWVTFKIKPDSGIVFRA